MGEAQRDNIVIDREHMQVDRSTDIGKGFAMAQEAADKEQNPAMAKFMNQLLAYSEACLVIDGTIDDPREKSHALSKLRDKFDRV